MSDTTLKTEAPAGAVSAVIQAAATIELPKLLDKALIKKDQDGIRVSLIKLDVAVHANAVQCLLHAEKHGDTSLMRRLLVDIVDAKSGYRRQGVIAWMREFSPMELKGDIIALSGTINGERRPFRCEEANRTPFTELASAREMVPFKPIFKDNLTSKVERALKDYKAAIENTIVEAGKEPAPKDPKKPFYTGIHLNKMDEFFDTIEKGLAEVSSWNDSTKDVFVAREGLKKAELEMADASKN